MTDNGTLLVVEDDEEMRLFLEEELHDRGFRVIGARRGPEALDRLSEGPVDAVITDLRMPDMQGDELLAELRARDRDLPVVMITAFGSIETAVGAIKAGAYHYLAKPFRMECLLATVESALREKHLRDEVRRLREAFEERRFAIVAQSPGMKQVLDLVRRAATADTPVLLTGESGTGKELLARALHSGSRRSSRPFLAVNCSAIPETLLESQLFGHRRGAFTDAREDRRGLLMEAQGGTVLLDEIGDMQASLQAKILRVLQEKEVHPLGAPAPIPVDVRIVAATHRDLESLVAGGRFRHDLYYRLNVITIRVPPLRERMDDLVPLIAHFLEKHGRRLGRSGCALSPEAMDALLRHSWPGNARELENVIERALVLGRDDVLRLDDLPESLRTRPASVTAAGGPPRPLSEVERDHIVRTMREVRGNKAAAARLLGLDRKTLYRKLELYGIGATRTRDLP
ncbi:MAG TPA: sigma-54 dependent transcriptional regulator [Candidatus Polarisedimenticolia bacterium]|nr:sigma-54 dependent transcriptional regulator [Candidatus Polarisedimenticolia bacterium]